MRAVALHVANRLVRRSRTAGEIAHVVFVDREMVECLMLAFYSGIEHRHNHTLARLFQVWCGGTHCIDAPADVCRPRRIAARAGKGFQKVHRHVGIASRNCIWMFERFIHTRILNLQGEPEVTWRTARTSRLNLRVDAHRFYR